jgi:hypothetical protein
VLGQLEDFRVKMRAEAMGQMSSIAVQQEIAPLPELSLSITPDDTLLHTNSSSNNKQANITIGKHGISECSMHILKVHMEMHVDCSGCV